ncbi:MAG TPA: response regulator, partial [Cytophagales bacterium]|nr:response regulator [Cytophagales bacterium]
MENVGMDMTEEVKDKLKVLMLEDSESDAGLVVRVMKKANLAFDYIRIDSKEEFVEALHGFDPDLVLSDHSMPQFNSLEAFKIFRDMGMPIPFILITGSVSEEFAVRCLHEGIDDYILKNNLTRLPTAISHALEKKQLERKKKELELEQLATNERLRLQNQELEKANKELDRFVYSASHELRGPLASMLGLIELGITDLVENNLENLKMYLQMMGMSITRLNSIVEEIVNYSLNNRTDVRREAIEIYELLGKVFDKLSYLPHIDDVKRTIRIEQSHPWFGDKRR